jgi:3-hydroxybutyrate dehydrogenase
VCPGYVRTPLVESQIAAQAAAHGIPEERVVEEVLLAPQAVRRLLEPEEVADAAAYLLGPAGGFATGSPLVLDGVWSAR